MASIELLLLNGKALPERGPKAIAPGFAASADAGRVKNDGHRQDVPRFKPMMANRRLSKMALETNASPAADELKPMKPV